jgi:hypothetical protein
MRGFGKVVSGVCVALERYVINCTVADMRNWCKLKETNLGSKNEKKERKFQLLEVS